jgi:hypothetical protein
VEEVSDVKAAYASTIGMTERMYKKPAKPVPGVGDQAGYVENLKVLYAIKGKYLVSSYFTGGKYNTEANIVKLSETVLRRVK